MEIEKTRGYGIAASDIEGSWDPALKAKIKKAAFKTIMKQISFLQKVKLFILFNKEKKKASEIDLSDIRAKGMKNETFIKQQLEYISLFSALVKLFDRQKALKIMYNVMDVTAEALLTSLPKTDDVKKYGDSFEFFRKYFAAGSKAAKEAGCHEIIKVEETAKSLQFNINYCVWFELAKKMNVPEACLPNCYADDLVYPGYFTSVGIKYSRNGTLANGQKYCCIRFEKI